MLNGLDLFSGIGGMSVALKEWVRPVAYCEIDPYCQAVLLSRMGTGAISKAPIWDNISTFPWNPFIGNVDIIYGGFPCQDISIAGNGKGLEGNRSGLFFEVLRLAKEIKPTFVFLENVPAICRRGGEMVIASITALGYDCRWCVISAASAGALHKRDRWFLLAHLTGDRSQKAVNPIRLQKEKSFDIYSSKQTDWPQEPENKFELAGMVRGLPDRTHRIKALGNSVVPQQAKEAFKILMGLK